MAEKKKNGGSFTLAERAAREKAVRRMVKNGMTVVQIARELGIQRQAAWEFMNRRGLLPEQRGEAPQS